MILVKYDADLRSSVIGPLGLALEKIRSSSLIENDFRCDIRDPLKKCPNPVILMKYDADLRSSIIGPLGLALERI